VERLPESISADSVREQVSRILRSEGFARAERLRRFLKFTVDHALDGRSAELKVYLVGTEVFDKDASFDPQINTTVRVEARRLRTALVTYYASTGQSDPILIEYPKGTYAPVFRNRGAFNPQQPPAETPAAGQPSSAVVPRLRYATLEAFDSAHNHDCWTRRPFSNARSMSGSCGPMRIQAAR
jgi:hypothetical protein